MRIFQCAVEVSPESAGSAMMVASKPDLVFSRSDSTHRKVTGRQHGHVPPGPVLLLAPWTVPTVLLLAHWAEMHLSVTSLEVPFTS